MNPKFHSSTQTFFKGKSVVITGGSGFIGSHLVEQVLQLGARPIVVSRRPTSPFLNHVRAQIEWRVADLVDGAQVSSALQGAPIILHLAAFVAGIEMNQKHPATLFQNNLLPFLNVIKAAHQLRVERFLVTSSACVYPRHCSIPTPEAEGTQGEPEPTNSGYGWAKRMEEYLGRKYFEEHGMSVAIARPYNAYGPRDNFDPQSSHVIPALIRRAVESHNGILSVWGDGSHSRSFLYADDFARGLLEVAARYPHADPLNVGAREEVTIGVLAEMIAEIVGEKTGRRLKVQFQSQGLTGQPRRMCDPSKIEKLLGYQTQVSLRDGLEKTIDWYLSQCPVVTSLSESSFLTE